jgi:hypothetical protein
VKLILRMMDGAASMDNLQSLLRAPGAASRNPSTNHGKESPVDVPESFRVAQKYGRT